MSTSLHSFANDISDNELISRINSGEYELFGVLLKRYHPLVKSVALLLANADSEVEDLIQEGDIALFSAVRAYDSQKANFSGFAAACVKNAVLDVLRRSSSKRKIPNAMISSFEDVEPHDYNTPEKIFFDNENYKVLTDSINIDLSRLEQQVLSAYLSGLSYAEIAKLLSVSVKSVDNSLARIRSKLKKHN